jgi:hypothetical protein
MNMSPPRRQFRESRRVSKGPSCLAWFAAIRGISERHRQEAKILIDVVASMSFLRVGHGQEQIVQRGPARPKTQVCILG